MSPTRNACILLIITAKVPAWALQIFDPPSGMLALVSLSHCRLAIDDHGAGALRGRPGYHVRTCVATMLVDAQRSVINPSLSGHDEAPLVLI